MITEHPDPARLSDFADSDLAPRDAAAVEQHVAGCPACRAELARLRALVDRAAALPESIEPPPELWSAVRSRLEMPVARAPRRSAGWTSGWAREWGLRAAAAVLLVAGSSAVTVLVLRTRQPDQLSSSNQSHATATPALPASARVIERSYAEVVGELTVTLNAQRGALAPATIATLERTLQIIDQAIAEARAALAADPGNGALLDVLSANYEQKVQLLRRASELPART
jgi:anti-sigma factor ChrR (cupin superfamily)